MPFMRSESCSFIWHPKVVTWKRLASGIEASGYRGLSRPGRAHADDVVGLVGVGVPGRADLARDRRAVSGGDLVDRVVDRPIRGAGAAHEDRAGPVAGADGDVVSPRRAMEVVPLAKAALLAFDDRDALAREDEEAF